METKIFPLVSRTISSLIRTQGVGDIYRIYFSAQSDGLDFHLAYILTDFSVKSDESFDLDYMKALFECGHNLINSDHPWIEELD